MMRVNDVSRLEGDAAGRLDPVTSTYISGGAGDSVTANLNGWSRLRLRPRMLRDVSTVSTGTTVLGASVRAPILIAPTAMHCLVHPDGERATAAGAASSETVYVLSMAATTALEDVAAAAPGSTQWLQMYVLKDRGATRAVCERAAAAGFRALVVTVDAPVDRSDAGFIAQRPLNAGLPLPNLAPGLSTPDIAEVVAGYEDRLCFDDLGDISSWARGLPVVVKGILRGDDARLCIGAGARAIAVSNHGGRQVPGCISTADALPDVVDAVGGDAEVYVDGGIRSGADVVRALAIGARAVLVGRPVLWGLALDGASGVAAVLAALERQTRQVLGLCGLRDATEAHPDLLQK